MVASANYKSVFAKILEFKDQMHAVPSLPPSTALKAVYIIDGMAMIQILKSAAASTFGELACNYYTSIAAPLIIVAMKSTSGVFDQYWESSIEVGERTRRGSSSLLEVHIHGPSPQAVGQIHRKSPKQGQPVRFRYNNDVPPR